MTQYCQFTVESESNGVRAIVCPRCTLTRQWARERLPIAVCSPERQAMIEAWKAEQAERSVSRDNRPVRLEVTSTRTPLTEEEKAERAKKTAELKAKRLAEKKSKILEYVAKKQPVSAYETMDKAPCGCKGTAHKIIMEMVAEGILRIDEKGIMLSIP